MKTSIIPELINSNSIKILDENFIPIKICEKSQFLFNPSNFINPSITIEVYEASRYKEVEIKRIDLNHLDREGFRLVSISLKSNSRMNMRNYRGQKKAYMIKRKTDPLEGANEMFKMPQDHVIEMDILNKRVRVKGRNSYPYNKVENCGKWVEIKNG